VRRKLGNRHGAAATATRARPPQVSEDHCWLSLDGSGARGAAVEVTTDTAAKRGLAPSEDAWRGWLYSGGHAVVCSHKVRGAAGARAVDETQATSGREPDARGRARAADGGERVDRVAQPRHQPAPKLRQ
jgi:hypothetical protein